MGLDMYLSKKIYIGANYQHRNVKLNYTMCQQPLILKTMEKLYFKTTGQEPDVNCIEPCKYEDRPSEGTMIGSGECQDCRACYGWDSEENWVKCLNYSMEKQGLHVRLA